ncbi:MAG TPA: hypothetical protein VGH03_09435 [Caulobacteraceae bacterium]
MTLEHKTAVVTGEASGIAVTRNFVFWTLSYTFGLTAAGYNHTVPYGLIMGRTKGAPPREGRTMLLKSQDFCPPLDATTLLEFRSDAYQACAKAPDNQQASWLAYYRQLSCLLDHAHSRRDWIGPSLN